MHKPKPNNQIVVSRRCLRELFSFLLGCVEWKKPPRVVFTSILINHLDIKGNIMGIKLPLDKQFTVFVEPQDSAGNAAAVEGVPAWSTSSDVVTVTPAADGLSAVVRPNATGTVGSVQISVTADADLGEGVEPITGILDVDVIGGKAVSLATSVGPLEPLTPA